MKARDPIRAALDRAGIRQRDLTKLLRLSRSSMSRKFSGERGWSVRDIQTLLWLLRKKDPTITYESLLGAPKPLRRRERDRQPIAASGGK